MDTSKLITPQDAVLRAGVDVSTIHRWCKEFGIGIKCGGRWKVDVNKLNLVLSGVLHSPIVRKSKEK